MSTRTTIGAVLSLLVWATLAQAGCGSTEDEGEASHFFDCRTDADCPDEQVCTLAGEGPEKRCSPRGADAAPLGSDNDGGVPADSGSADSGGDIHDLVCGACAVREVNDRGDIVFMGQDLNCDGVADNGCSHTEYDESGRWILSRSDIPCDGPLGDDCNVVDVQVDGADYSAYHDEGCDGVPEDCSAVVTTAAGTELSTFDSDCDGVPNDCAERDPVSHINSQDDGCDGVLDHCTLFNDEGYGIAHDTDCDGTMDWWCVTLRYDDLGRLERLDIDEDCDGSTFESYVDTTYAADGRTFWEEAYYSWTGQERTCSGGSVASENEHTFSYEDLDCDGVPDNACGQGGTLTNSADENCDGVFDWCTVAFDASGAILEAGDGERCLGTPSECVLVTSR